MKLTVTKISLGGNPTRFGGSWRHLFGFSPLCFFKCVLNALGGSWWHGNRGGCFPPNTTSPPFAIVCLGKRTTTSEDKSNKNKNDRRNSGGMEKNPGGSIFWPLPFQGAGEKIKMMIIIGLAAVLALLLIPILKVSSSCRDAKSGRYGRYICAILSKAVLIFVQCTDRNRKHEHCAVRSVPLTLWS